MSGTTARIHDPLGRLVGATYSSGEAYAYQYDAAGHRTALTETTPLSGTTVTTYTYDAANRLAVQARSDGRVYTYTWSARGQLLAESTQGYPVRTFTYDTAGRLTQATVFTLTTRFTYHSDGVRVAVEVVGQGTTTYTLDYAAGNRILAETTPSGTVAYLFGLDCLGELRAGAWLYYLPDAAGLVRQGTDAQGAVTSAWRFDPDGAVTEGPEGPVSHLVCGGVYDWSTGLIYQGGRYFDPSLGLWLTLLPLAVISTGRGRRGKRRGGVWLAVVCLAVGMGGTLTACNQGSRPPICTPTFLPGQGPGSPSPTPGMGITPTPTLPPGNGTAPAPPPLTPTPTPTPGPAGKGVYLTFDDGPGWYEGEVANTNTVLDTLITEQVKATFFILGGGLSNGGLKEYEWNTTVRRIVNEGHSWGLHGWDHKFATDERTQEHLIWEMEQIQAAVNSALGTTTASTIWRAPGGLYPGNPGYPDDPAIKEAVESRGFGQYKGWNVDSLDYQYSNVESDKLRDDVVNRVQTWWNENGYAPVVLLHCTKDVTANALPGIIQGLRTEGFEFYTL